MTFEQALRDVLTGSPLHLMTGDRITPGVLQRASDMPAMTFQIVAGRADYTHQGPSGLHSKRVQFDCYGRTHAEAVALKGALMAVLSGFKHGSGNPGPIQGAFLTMETEGYDGATDKAGPKKWRKTLDFTIWHEETY